MEQRHKTMEELTKRDKETIDQLRKEIAGFNEWKRTVSEQANQNVRCESDVRAIHAEMLGKIHVKDDQLAKLS